MVLLYLVTLLLLLLSAYVGLALTRWAHKRARLVRLVGRLPGLDNKVPLVENALMMRQFQEIAMHRKLDDTFALAYSSLLGIQKANTHLGIVRYWLGTEPVVVLNRPDFAEAILSHPRVLNKSPFYQVFEPWMGQGLILSKREIWQFRRKVLTPSFHFRILAEFLPVINKEASRLAQKLAQKQYSNGSRVNIVPLTALCTLDTICETAMGSKMDNLAGESSPYVRALHDLAETALARVTRPWLWSDLVFYRTEFGRKFVRSKRLMHQFTRTIIEQRKREWQQVLGLEEEEAKDKEKQLTQGLARKRGKPMAFLDQLLQLHLIEHTLTLDEIQEEVDTFMFAGHDTTAMSVNWTLYMLGLNTQVQEKARAELDELLGPEEEDNLDAAQLRQLKYLDQLIKESLRYWPSVPFVLRQMSEDVELAGGEYLIPKGAHCLIFTHSLHHNPNVYPRPEVFDPERFSSEQALKRHPYAYLPFSAGPRNCIGQKFAQMEVKVILAKLIRKFHIEACEPLDKLWTVGELVLRPTSGLYIRLTPRKK